MAKISDVDNSSLLFTEGSAPSTPATSKWRVYFKTDGLYVIDDAGSETGPLSTGGGAGVTVATAVGDKSNTARTTTSTTYVDLTDISTTIAATAGDLLEVSFVCSTYHSASTGFTKFAVNISNTGTIAEVLHEWPVANEHNVVALLGFHTVVSGDISGGNVTVKVQWKVNAGTGTVSNNNEHVAPVMVVKNYGQ